MIFYLATREHYYTIAKYLTSWGQNFQGRIKIFPYDDFLDKKDFPIGTYVFSDLERLSIHQLNHAAAIWKNLRESGKCKLLNHPNLSMRRYELLRTLYELKWNQFNVYRLDEFRLPQQFPVFVRLENDHEGARTQLFKDKVELTEHINEILQLGISRNDKIMTEFCDTSDSNGLYRKYSAFKVGDRIIARHLFFDHKWVIKYPQLLEPDFLKEELEYVQNNPHEMQLQQIFKIARIDYGRIDYALLNGKIQTWEINTNPMILIASDYAGLERLPIQHIFQERLAIAWEALL